MRSKYTLLVVIAVIAVTVRIWGIGAVPASPDWDEVALGYNAYSILQTGKDEYGQMLPIIFRSFDDYKPGLFVYLTLPFVALGGLTVAMVRLPSVIIGTLAVVGVYFLVKALLSVTGKNEEKLMPQQEAIALASAGLMAISPWHIQFSRVAFEASVGMAFTVFGTLFFLKGLKNHAYWYLTALFFSLAIYVYQSEKVFIPLLSLVLGLLFWRSLIDNWKKVVGPAILFVAIAVPFYYQTLANPDALLRARGVSLFADQTPFLERSVSRLIHDEQTGNIVGKLFDNRRVEYGIGFIKGYISHFDINWLFLTGDEKRHNPPNFGHLYLFELPFLIAGLYLFLFGNYSKKAKLLLFSWLIITPIPASITSGTPHPIRTIHFLPGLHIVSAVAVVAFFSWIHSGKNNALIRFAAAGIASSLIVANITYYLDQYFVQYNYESSQAWQYGYREAVSIAESLKHEYSTIVVSSEQPLDQSYMFFLFYTRYDPRLYLAEGGTYSGGFAQENRFDKYVFRPIDWESEPANGETLYIGRPDDIPGTRLITINYLNGTPAIVMGVR